MHSTSREGWSKEADKITIGNIFVRAQIERNLEIRLPCCARSRRRHLVGELLASLWRLHPSRGIPNPPLPRTASLAHEFLSNAAWEEEAEREIRPATIKTGLLLKIAAHASLQWREHPPASAERISATGRQVRVPPGVA